LSALTRRALKSVAGEWRTWNQEASCRGSNAEHAGGSLNRAMNPGLFLA